MPNRFSGIRQGKQFFPQRFMILQVRMLCMNGLHQRLPELVERHEGFLAFKVTIAVQRTNYTICDHFKDKVFPDETAISFQSGVELYHAPLSVSRL